jgi:hypothetical protein
MGGTTLRSFSRCSIPKLCSKLRADLGCDDAEWERGKAWAFAQAMGLVWYYVTTNPTMASVGRRTLDRLLQAFGERRGADDGLVS